MDPAAAAIVEFWLGDSVDGPQAAERRRAVWYHGGAALDRAIAARFASEVDAALAGRRDHWADDPRAALALVIVLDQFTRHCFRNTREAYAGDVRALAVAQAVVAAGGDRTLPVTGRLFLYHPFHHAESLALQDRGVALVDGIRRDVPAPWHEYLDRRVAGFTRHRDIVARFGRFPHRNAVLGRRDTPDEAAYLAGDHERFGQGGEVSPRPDGAGT